MNLEEIFDEFFKLPFPMRATGLPTPKPQASGGDLPINGRTGGCHGKHTLVEVGKRQEQVDFVNQNDVPLRGFRVYSKVKCLKCPYECEFLKI